jgi:hypothetical protein
MNATPPFTYHNSSLLLMLPISIVSLLLHYMHAMQWITLDIKRLDSIEKCKKKKEKKKKQKNSASHSPTWLLYSFAEHREELAAMA